MDSIKPNTIVVLDIPSSYNGYEEYYENLLGIKQGDYVLCLGEISNMPEHYSVVKKDGTIVLGLHPDLFRLPTDDEL